jgi:hypothetical protein
MGFASIKKPKGEAFQRLTLAQRANFAEMAALLAAAKRMQKSAGSKPNTLCIEHQLLMMLENWREYRTYFHIGRACGISETAAYPTSKGAETRLTKSKSFRLPGRKAVAASDRASDVALIDATKTPIERPNKIKAHLFWQEEAAHPESAACYREINPPHSLHRARSKDSGTKAVQDIEGAAAS